ncbi:hypothetical protein U9M48_012710 [Paspalum notatum var. saurae]|uniref:GRF-type domain-containing protein n=1 Tax=Paspalum notatum var. saurae TaxID=547442 RepID=A0AAQ3WIH7_PASNO
MESQISRLCQFDYYVVVDFEATCEKDSQIYPQEVIEFPAVLVHGVTGELVSAFRTYWINLRVPFESVFGKRRRNLQEAVQEAGLQWDGRPHCGLDDARNTALLLSDLMRRGVTMSITCMFTVLMAPKEDVAPQPPLQLMPQPQPLMPTYCYCGIPIKSGLVMTPGPTQGHCFYTCGNWMSEFGLVSFVLDGHTEAWILLRDSLCTTPGWWQRAQQETVSPWSPGVTGTVGHCWTLRSHLSLCLARGAATDNLQEAVQEAGLQWDGRPHCGFDDACNTALLLSDLMQRGVTMSITGMFTVLMAPKEDVAPQPPLQLMAQPQPQPQPQMPTYCYCGIPIKSGLVMTPGPTQGHCFYICCNWTPEFRETCPFFLWAA